MDNFIIELFGGSKIEITFEEYQSLIGSSGLVFLKSCSQTINTSAIKRICPKKVHDIDQMMMRKEKQKEGILHDGTQVFRHFGQWYKINGDYDEKGNPTTRFDPELYPEVGHDCVPTKEEFYCYYAHLPQQERLPLILKRNSIEPRNGNTAVLKDLFGSFLGRLEDKFKSS